MTEPLHGEKFTIDGAERTLRFTMNAHRIAKKRLGRPVRDAMRDVAALDVDTICELAAAGFTEGRPKLSKEVITPERVARWLDEEPAKLPALAVAVATALRASWERMFEGEANAADASAKSEAESAAMLQAMTTDPTTTSSATGGPTSDG
jgi:hypothetical protein